MSAIEIANLENAGRVAMGWSPEGYDQKSRVGGVLVALLPAASILLVAVTLLISVI